MTNGFFENAAHQLRRDGNPFPLTEVVGQELESPALLPGWRRAAGQGGQSSLLLPIQLAVPILPCGPVLQGGLNPFGGCAFAPPFDGRTAHLNRFGDLGISPLRSFGTGIRLQEDTGTGRGPSRPLAFLDGLLQQEAFGIGEGDHV